MGLDQSRAADVICVGEPLGEFSAIGDRLYRLGFGGDVSNVAVAIARSSGSAALAGRLGEDWIGNKFREFWNGEGISADGVLRDRGAPTGVYFIEYDETGHHFEYMRSGSAASFISPADVPGWGIEKAKVDADR